MFKKLFNKEKKMTIKAPMTGNIVPIEEVPDQVFSGKMVGDGVAIEPTEGVLVAPVDAEVAVVFPTMHAIGLKTADNIEILLHIGVETVAMKGEGFECFVKQGDQVKTGQKLVTFNIDLIKEKARSILSPIVISNVKDIKSMEKASGNVSKGESDLLTVLK